MKCFLCYRNNSLFSYTYGQTDRQTNRPKYITLALLSGREGKNTSVRQISKKLTETHPQLQISRNKVENVAPAWTQRCVSCNRCRSGSTRRRSYTWGLSVPSVVGSPCPRQTSSRRSPCRGRWRPAPGPASSPSPCSAAAAPAGGPKWYSVRKYLLDLRTVIKNKQYKENMSGDVH